MNLRRALVPLSAFALAAFAFSAADTLAAAQPSQLVSQYSSWAGSKSNADSLVRGLRGGTPVMLSTTGADRTVSLAGFTPSARMSDEQVAAALAQARASLARLGIQRPSAEQIQAALIGGEVQLPRGGTRVMAGSLGEAGTGGVVATR